MSEIVHVSRKFLVPVDYNGSGRPSYLALQQQFGENVDCNFDQATFEPVDACKDLRYAPRDVEFMGVFLTKKSSYEEALEEIDGQGLRPVLHVEMIAIDKARPDVTRDYRYGAMALGDSTFIRERGGVHPIGYYIACIWSISGHLSLHPVERGFNTTDCLLVTSKS